MRNNISTKRKEICHFRAKSKLSFATVTAILNVYRKEKIMELNERALYEFSFFKYMESIGYPAEMMLRNFKTLSSRHIDLAVFAEDLAHGILIYK